MEKLFTDFESVSYDQWLKKIEQDLKGKSMDLLHKQPEADLETKAYYHPEEGSYSNIAGNFNPDPNWKIRQQYTGNDSNDYLLSTLNDGVNHLGLELNDQTSFNEQTKGVMFEHISADIAFTDPETAKAFTSDVTTDLSFDVIKLNQKVGKWNYSLVDFIDFYRSQPNHNTVWVNGSAYGNAGATSIQELAFTLAHLNEYLHALKENEEDISKAFSKIIIQLSCSGNFVVSIAKFRAIRELIKLVATAYEIGDINPIKLYGTTGRRQLCQNDHNNNLLRQTTQCAAAAIGGCDVITVDVLNKSDANAKRLAKNIQLVLKEESFLNKVSDPSGGAYAIERMTDQLIEKAWKLFQRIESEEGLIEWIKNDKVHQLISENRRVLIEQLNENKETLLGVNKYRSNLEEWKETNETSFAEGMDFTPMTDFILEEQYEPKTVTE